MFQYKLIHSLYKASHASMNNEEYDFHRQRSQSELGIVRLIKWAFSNPEKVAAVGIGMAAFGLAAFFLESHKDSVIMKSEDAEAVVVGGSSAPAD
jgi:hypothetical protein